MSTAKTIPLWEIEEVKLGSDAAQSDHVHDAIVIGAGVAGLTTAICLLREGHQVLVLERENIGAGESGRTTAHLASALDDRFYELARHHGREGARLAAESHAAAVDWIESFAYETDDCDFHRIPGYLFSHDGNLSRLEREMHAASDAGLSVTYLPTGAPGLEHLGPVLRFENQARVDMGRYLDALAKEALRLGGRFIQGEASEVTGGALVKVCVGNLELTARAVVVASNVPFHQTNSTFHKQAPYRSYAVAGKVEEGAVRDALYWDDGDPYHYVRLHTDRSGALFLIVGGEDHKTGQGDDPEVYKRLHEWTDKHFPGVEKYTYAWSGQILEPVDGLGFAGADPDNENVYLVTGDSGNGVTHGTLAGMLIADQIQGKPNAWGPLYDPGRKATRGVGEWLKENVNVAAQYRDWISPGQIRSPEDLALGTGGILRRGFHKVAVYRSGEGTVHAHNARCPHLGCVVRWSSEEKSWDCPCHGSRFEAETGAVLNGPSSDPLAPFDLASLPEPAE
jgi:glycine/D-amino acid oxidase-like deaminating enzyme/nitrite reductase/ring-hydroxylating ferredoxin subunit